MKALIVSKNNNEHLTYAFYYKVIDDNFDEIDIQNAPECMHEYDENVTMVDHDYCILDLLNKESHDKKVLYIISLYDFYMGDTINAIVKYKDIIDERYPGVINKVARGNKIKLEVDELRDAINNCTDELEKKKLNKKLDTLWDEVWEPLREDIRHLGERGYSNLYIKDVNVHYIGVDEFCKMYDINKVIYV